MDFKKLLAYHKSFDLAVSIFEISKTFPKEETYALTDQIRRSSDLYVLIFLKLTEKDVILSIILAS